MILHWAMSLVWSHDHFICNCIRQLFLNTIILALAIFGHCRKDAIPIIAVHDRVNSNYQANWPNCCKFSGQWPRSLWNLWRWKSQFTPQPATQFTVLYHWEVSVRISTLTLRFHGNLSYFLFILLCCDRIYIYTHHVGYVCSLCISIVL